MLDCYPLDEKQLKISIKTGKDVDGVYLYAGDPFAAGISASEILWQGERFEMKLERELRYHNIWSVMVCPKYKRLKYHFEILAGEERIYCLEDGFYESLETLEEGYMLQRFIYPWMNPGDLCTTPDWVADTIWYQIFPERFCQQNPNGKRFVNNQWISQEDQSWFEYYGGDLAGIRSRLPYLQDLGITGIYLTPIFLSNTNHKYDTIDYWKIDPDFGDEEEMMALVEDAHQRGIRIMVDAVMNHSGFGFEPWQDVLKNGKDSSYYDWFFINKWPLEKQNYKTHNGDFYSFAFEAYMPKLNTNNPEVMAYFGDICKHWTKDWNVDGIRFDVGNEVSHGFIKFLHGELRKIKPDLFLLGEIWHDSLAWLLGDEYDSVMNYPFVATMNNFWFDQKQTGIDFKFNMNKGFSMYFDQVNQVLFNFLDSHDIDRAMERCKGDTQVLLQQLLVLMTMEGSPCIYYGTEIGMMGAGTKANRKCMPWDEIDAGKYQELTEEVKTLIRLRKEYPQTRSGQLEWLVDESRVLHYVKKSRNQKDLHVLINCSTTPFPVAAEEILYEKGLEAEGLVSGGMLVYLT